MAGDGLLHPVVLLAIGVLLVNDHVLKAAWPGVVTGKLSDFAGLLFFPLFLQAVWEVGAAAVGRGGQPSRTVLVGAIVATGTAFAAIQLVPMATDGYRHGLGLLQWLAGLPLAILTGQPGHGPVPAQLTPDPTDLLALAVLPLVYLIGRRRCPAPARRASGRPARRTA